MSTNLVEDLTGEDAFGKDAIASGVIGEHAPWSRPNAERLGRAVWDPATLAAARDAHRHLPELRTHDRLGRRIDVVDFHPAYHELMATAFGHGVHALAWTATRPGAHLARAVQSYLWNQVDGATACPTGMAYAAVPALRDTPELAAYAERVARHDYDPAYAPVETKHAATVGYAMTEKQGGSDLRANVTVARPLGRRGPGRGYLLNGHKWFCSAPMSDGFFTVAQTEAGPGCYFVPRWRDRTGRHHPGRSRAASGQRDRAGRAGRAAGPVRAGRGGRCVLRHPAGRRLGPDVRHAAGGRRRRVDHRIRPPRLSSRAAGLPIRSFPAHTGHLLHGR
jgi:putative acyl-CoA dehydrogenase